MEVPLPANASAGTSASRRRRRDEEEADAASLQPSQSGLKQCCDTVKQTLRRHAKFIGPGLVASVAYSDPGNWATDLQAGAAHGYKLLFAVLLSGLFAILLQVLACRLGIVTGLDLACSSRQLILGPFGSRAQQQQGQRNGTAAAAAAAVNRPRWEKWLRYGTLWGIYLIAEAAIVATELAELVGSAIALNLLFPKLPLWGGVLVTSADVFLILFVYRPKGGLRAFEVLISVLVIIVLACYIVLLVRVKPDWPEAFKGYLPSSTLVQHDALYIAVGILGATVMPHGLFLGSHFSTVNRLESDKVACEECLDQDLAPVQPNAGHSRSLSLNGPGDRDQASGNGTLDASAPRQLTVKDKALNLLVRMFPRIDIGAFIPSSSSSRGVVKPQQAVSGPRIPDLDPDATPDVKLGMVKTHLPHASIDIALSLLAFAITINSAILIVAAAATRNSGRQVDDLFEAFDLLKTTVGHAAAILFAVALLAAGQSASLTVCLAGQIISEGFIRWKTSPLTRRMLTRVIAMVPSLIVASAVGRDGVDALLVGSQVVLSMALPFVVAPLLIITCMKSWMRVWEDAPTQDGSTSVIDNDEDEEDVRNEAVRDADADRTQETTAGLDPPTRTRTGAGMTTALELESGGKWHHFQTWWPVAIVAWAVFGVICIADVFTLVTL
ncbi:unnamed protein product [Tilletia laevis]|uniref:Uncharacterized protein n=2 Tax=Tilletia TaxID=13289 RepID=A0A177VE58_9BASI|nr:hypothetical protein CF336_g21 [Tilletia laevis]KAE8265647.1 hypothetical protein A4X03_0g129 [Tilletia caries]CAD6928031.1 unnamed protein product [Tilletia controversa]KAE8208968.1 hypothetical protein CF335_g23 [Tilletia laevis]CAD6883894.1 unnamed protein product [Tilletia caries]